MKFNTNSLYIVSTPIGNLDDITLRAIDVLKNSDIILCEDTRRSLKLFNHLKIKKKLIPYHKFNEKKQFPNIIEHIKEGKILSLISDAGTPLLSDPGRLLLNKCLENRGYAYITTPDIASRRVPKNILEWDVFSPPRHVQFFCQDNIVRLFEKHGFMFVKRFYDHKAGLRVLFRKT